ncbi:MAG: ATP-binding protein, partial [Planctomycetota bacterium]
DYTYTVRVKDGRSVETRHNPNCEAVTGYTPEDFAGDDLLWIAMVPEADRPGVLAQTEAVLRGETPPPLEHRLVRRDGATVWVRSVLIPHWTPEGTLHEYTGILSDISEQKTAERNEARYRDALEATYELATTNRGSTLTEICESAALKLASFLEVDCVVIRVHYMGAFRTLSLARGGRIRTDDLAVEACPFCDHMDDAHDPTCSTGSQAPSHDAACRRKGDYASFACQPVVNSNQKRIGLICALDHADTPFHESDLRLMEIFARHIAFEVELAEQRTALLRKERNEMLGQIAGAFAHEVRNPLNGISVTMELLREKLKERDDLRKYLDRLDRQSHALANLMDDLLQIRRPVQPDAYVRKDALALCRDSLAAWKEAQTGLDGRTWRCEADGDEVPVVSVDPDRFVQVLGNLLSNAAQHSPDGSTVSLRVGRHGKDAVIRLSDEGAGIQADPVESVFDPFFTTRKRGSGLGLSIVRHVIEQHGGQILAYNHQSAPGCTFEIRLPAVD